MFRAQRGQEVDSIRSQFIFLRCPGLQRTLESGPLEAGHVFSRGLRPDGFARVEVGPFAHGVPLALVIQEP